MDAVQYRIESEDAERRDAQNEQAAQDQGGGDGEAYHEDALPFSGFSVWSCRPRTAWARTTTDRKLMMA